MEIKCFYPSTFFISLCPFLNRLQHFFFDVVMVSFVHWEVAYLMYRCSLGSLLFSFHYLEDTVYVNPIKYQINIFAFFSLYLICKQKQVMI